MIKSRAVRKRVHDKFGGRCAYCGVAMEYKVMQVDHFLPRVKKVLHAV